MQQSDILGFHNNNLDIGSGGVGYVVVPVEDEREDYINDCYRTHRVTIQGGRGYSLFNNVPAPPYVIDSIHFPKEGEFGTPVIWVKDGVSKLPIIVGYLTKEGEGYIMDKNQYRLIRGNGFSKTVEFFIDGEESELQISLLGDADSPAKFKIKINSKNEDSEVDIYCDNKLSITSDKELDLNTSGTFNLNITDAGKTKAFLKYVLGEGLVYEDEFKNKITAHKGELKVESQKINLGTGAQPLVLGNSLNNLLGELIDTITTMVMAVTLPTAVLSPPAVAKLTTIKGKLDSLLSKLSNTD